METSNSDVPEFVKRLAGCTLAIPTRMEIHVSDADITAVKDKIARAMAIKPEDTNEDLISVQLYLLKSIFKYYPESARKAVGDIIYKTALWYLSEIHFKNGAKFKSEGHFIWAADCFAVAADLKKEIGDKEGRALSLSMQAESYSKVDDAGHGTSLSAREAMEAYKELNDQEGVSKAEELLNAANKLIEKNREKKRRERGY